MEFKEAELCLNIHCRNVAATSCCSQVLWMKTQLRDYGVEINKIPILCDLKSAIEISENPVQHSKTKHIDIRYHFLKHHVEQGTIEMYFVSTDYQLSDLFTKALDNGRASLQNLCEMCRAFFHYTTLSICNYLSQEHSKTNHSQASQEHNNGFPRIKPIPRF